MARKLQQATIDEDQVVEVRIRVPLPLHRTLTAYCAFRGFDPQSLPLVARSALRLYCAANDPFQKWLRQHPEALAGGDTPAEREPPKSAEPRPKAVLERGTAGRE
jgi:hypothetical protein